MDSTVNRKKIADEEFREIAKIINGHRKTLNALAKNCRINIDQNHIYMVF